MKSLVWLASYPKSGNTWLRLLFAAYTKPEADENFNLTDAFQATMSESRRTTFEKIAGKSDLSEQETDELREAVQIDLANRARPPVLIKTHNARVRHNGYPVIRSELTLGGIYIVRNPLDVVDSVADHWGVDHSRAVEMVNNERLTIGGPDDDLVTQYLSSWSGHVHSWIDHNAFPVHVVCYEDLLMRTEIAFRNILTFLGWKHDSERMRIALAATDFRRLQLKEKASGFGERSKKSASGKFFRVGRSGRWQETLTEEQVTAIISAHSSIMRRFGYAQDSSEACQQET